MYKSNKFCDILGIEKGLTAVIGSGGKTSLIMKLAEELAPRGRVILCTSTHIMRPEDMPVATTLEEARALFEKCCPATERSGAVCLGTPAENGKLTAPKESFEELTKEAEYVLVEADGSKRLPLKCHAFHEPVIPENAGLTVLVIGLSGIGKKAVEVVHRPELLEKLTGLTAEDIVTADAVAKTVTAEIPVYAGNFENDRFAVFINQVDTEEDMRGAGELAAGLKNIRCYAGSVNNGNICSITTVNREK